MSQQNTPLLDVYRQILTKLKKRRFFSKPNFDEAVDGFTELLKALRRGEEDEYSGLVSISIAKCHQQQQNTLLEALYYHRAGKFFLNSQKQMAVTGTSTFQELTELAMEFYITAISLYLEQRRLAMAASLYYELAEHLSLVKRTKEASLYYEKAAELQQTDNAMSAIVSLHKAFACDLKHAQYQHASETLQWIIKLATEQSTLNSDTFYVDVKVEAMVSFILVLILQGDFPQARLMTKHLQKEHGDIPATSGTAKNVNIFFTSEWFFALMECLVDAVESANEREVIKIQSELKELLTPSQNEILVPILQASRVNFV
eukprot:TRINITY_DN9758_c0_g1_i1.p1 TRINITY_DN9758_c0_g1~~TRINITY_DN9758_c0_g1_i1.p1  ORF type:complete len:316 (-),score=82.60 TRINITY_DN9758_c0_g1_i1:12-959(-)